MSQSLSANIHPNAKIGENVTIEPFSSIYDNVEIGDGTWVGPNVTIMSGARIGKNCKIFPGAVISAEPQDLKYKGEDSLTIIGNNTVIRECVTIHKGTADRMKTAVGNNCLLMAYVHVAHDCIIHNNVIIASYTGLAGHCTVHDYAIIEGRVGVQQFINIGAHSFVAGHTGVRKNVPPYVKAAREPISYCGVNTIGLKRRNYSPEAIEQIERIYRTIFIYNQNISSATAQVEQEEPDSEEKEIILNFIKNSDKGIIKGIN